MTCSLITLSITFYKSVRKNIFTRANRQYYETLALAELRQEEAEAEGLDPIDVEFPEWDVPEDY